MLGQGHELLQLICLPTEREAEVEVVILRKFLSSLNVNFPKQIKELFWFGYYFGNKQNLGTQKQIQSRQEFSHIFCITYLVCIINVRQTLK